MTLLLLSAYLFSTLVYRFFFGGEEFHMRSRWMLVFAAARNGFESLRARVFGQPREHVHDARQYGVKTAYGIGMIHGVGAETGTQALVITTAVGAGSKVMGVVALSMFVLGVLMSSNTIVRRADDGELRFEPAAPGHLRRRRSLRGGLQPLRRHLLRAAFERLAAEPRPVLQLDRRR